MRAIILAAGLGTRLRPFTDSIPKALIRIGGQPLIENQIKYLREIGIDEIMIVTGYLAHKLNYLKGKYGAHLIFNPYFDRYNNLYSMYLARQYLSNCYVLEADVYLKRNFLLKSPDSSTYFSGIKQDFRDEWILHFDENRRVYQISAGEGTDYIMSGVSYWNEDAGKIIADKLEEAVARNNYQELFWDEIVKNNLDIIDIRVTPINENDWSEIDSPQDLEQADR